MVATGQAQNDILAETNEAKREEISGVLTTAYWMEIETVMNYVANSINPDGVRGREISRALEADIAEELLHAQQFARRIKELYGVVPGSLAFRPEQASLQPPERQTDVAHVIRGVIEAEDGAIAHYNRILQATAEMDPVTNDMVVDVLREEQGHRRMFEGFLKEYESDQRG